MKRLRPLAAAFAAWLVLVPGMAFAIDIKQITTPLGIKAWLVEDKSTPVVALSFSFRAVRPPIRRARRASPN